jgi:8-amino-7-oxononanoate synthase
MPSLDDLLLQELDDLRSRDRLRVCPPMAGDSRSRPLLADTPVLSFASNDYLGLATHPSLRRAAADGALSAGVGSGASRLVAGDLPAHRSLETALALHFQTPAALLFPTGYQTNLAVLTTLAGREDLIVSDAANHASLIDGCRLSRATVRIYPHRDLAAARAALIAPGPFRRRFLVTESVFSMDGDIAPLGALSDLSHSTGASLIVDEAHAVGILGPAGRGSCAAAGVTPDVLIGALGKAFGTAGGFVAGSLPLRNILVNRARTFLFTTAAPPSIAAATEASLSILQGPEGDRLRATLRDRIADLRQRLAPSPRLFPSALESPILPFLLGTDAAALTASDHLRRQGIFVPAIRPPTVPENTARLRITLSAAHSPADMAQLAAALATLP